MTCSRISGGHVRVAMRNGQRARPGGATSRCHLCCLSYAFPISHCMRLIRARPLIGPGPPLPSDSPSGRGPTRPAIRAGRQGQHGMRCDGRCAGARPATPRWRGCRGRASPAAGTGKGDGWNANSGRRARWRRSAVLWQRRPRRLAPWQANAAGAPCELVTALVGAMPPLDGLRRGGQPRGRQANQRAVFFLW